MASTVVSESILSVLAPIKIDDAKFVSSTETENDTQDGPLWAIATPYAIGDRVRWLHVSYIAVKAGTGKDPSLVVNNKGDNAYWTKDKPTNKWALVDDEVSTATVSTGTSMTMVFDPGFFNSIGILAMDGEHLVVSVDVPSTGENLYTFDGPLESSQPPDYWEHFYDPFLPQTDFVVTDIAPYNTARASVTISRASGHCSIGMLAFGDIKPLGLTQYGATVSPKSYSYIDQNSYGETTIVRGKKATDMSVTARLKVDESPTVVRILQLVMDVPCLWIGTNLQNYSLRTFGLGNGKVTYDNYSDALLTVNIEGMI